MLDIALSSLPSSTSAGIKASDRFRWFGHGYRGESASNMNF
jgi:hypothetical protein